MNIKKFIIFLSVSVLFLVGAITLYIVIKPTLNSEEEQSIEFKKYNAIFELELFEENHDKYYIINGLSVNYLYGENHSGTLTIPESIDNIPIKKILSKEKAFSEYRALTKIIISKNIIYIGTNINDNSYGNKIFKESTNLKFIEVDENNPVYKSVNGILYSKDESILLKVPYSYVLNDELHFKVSDKVEHIYDDAFVNNKKLRGVTLSSSVKSIGDNAFNNCESLVNVEIPTNSNLEKIGNGTFKNCSSLTSLTFPQGLTYIGNMAFSTCGNLGGVYIPSSVVSFGLNIATASPNIRIYTDANNVNNLKNKYELFGFKLSEVDNRILQK